MAAHKHAELIKAWADGAKIQYFAAGILWEDIDFPSWDDSFQYRIKPAEPERAVVETRMTGDQLHEYYVNDDGYESESLVVVVNRAIEHALDAGQIVTREEFDRAVGDRAKRDMDIAVAVLNEVCMQMAKNRDAAWKETALSDIIKTVK